MSTIVATPTVTVRRIDLPRIDEEIERAGQPIRALGVVAGEIVELAEHDVDADPADEAHHHRIGDEPQDRTELEDAGHDHDHTGQDGQREQRPVGIVGVVDLRHVGHDGGHGTRRLDRHELRAGDEGAPSMPNR